MPYEMNANDVYSFAASRGAQVTLKGDELFFRSCPYCLSKDKDTFSVNIRTGAYKCFRASCGAQGHFVALCRDFGFPLDFGTERQYRRFPQRKTETREAAIEYLASRGIGEQVARQYGITVRKDNANVLVFPFTTPEGELVFIKYRKTDFVRGRDKNKEWCEKGGRPVLFGMEQCVDFGTLVITEGQIDSLSLVQAGINNAVSVPNGANGFTWIEHCWEWINKFENVIVFGDCEKGKITLTDELARRLDTPVMVVRAQDYLGEKDANDILRRYGAQALRDAVANAQLIPLERVKELADVQSVDLDKLPCIHTGIKPLDRAIGGLYFGQVILLTGRRGEGKSTFLSQLTLEALDQGFKVFVYSGELNDYHFKRWLDFQAAGTRNVNVSLNPFGDKTYSLSDSVVARISEWYRGRAYIYDNSATVISQSDESENEALLSTIEKAVRRYGINMVCIDNLMTALDVSLEHDLYRAQSKFLRALKSLAVRYNIVILLVAHPRKTNGELTNDDISGSGDISNRVDVVMSYSRYPDEDEDAPDSRLSVTKNRLTGRLLSGKNAIGLIFNAATKRIFADGDFGALERRYGWELASEGQEDDEDNGDLPF